MIALLDVSAGSTKFAETRPAEQGRFSGRPGASGIDVSEQLTASATVAAIVMVPPLVARLDGEATRPLIVGLDAFVVAAPTVGLVAMSAPTIIRTISTMRAGKPPVVASVPIVPPLPPPAIGELWPTDNPYICDNANSWHPGAAIDPCDHHTLLAVVSPVNHVDEDSASRRIARPWPSSFTEPTELTYRRPRKGPLELDRKAFELSQNDWTPLRSTDVLHSTEVDGFQWVTPGNTG